MMKKLLSIFIFACLLSFNSMAGVFASTDKNVYVSGDHIFCSVFCNDPDAIAYLELRSESSSLALAKAALNEGRGACELAVPFDIPTGNYCLVCHTASGSVDKQTLAIYNIFSTARKENGCVVVKSLPDADRTTSVFADGESRTSGKVRIERKDGAVTITNTSSEILDCALSISCADIIAPASEHPFRLSATLSSDDSESDGEVLHLSFAGRDTSMVMAETDVVLMGVMGDPESMGSCKLTGTEVLMPTENIYGHTNIVLMVDSNNEIKGQYYLYPNIRKYTGEIGNLGKLQLYPSYETALLRRARAVKADVSAMRDTIMTSLPMRRAHLLHDEDCKSFVLDDYNRFPTIEEEVVEILSGVRLRRESGQRMMQVILNDDVEGTNSTWGRALTLIDGVPVLDIKKIVEYDPALVKRVDVYGHRYMLGYKVYSGIVNFVTFKGNAPGVVFDDNTRIYDFQGCSYPVVFRGAHTLYWHPLLKLEPGQSHTVHVGETQSRNLRIQVQGL